MDECSTSWRSQVGSDLQYGQCRSQPLSNVVSPIINLGEFRPRTCVWRPKNERGKLQPDYDRHSGFSVCHSGYASRNKSTGPIFHICARLKISRQSILSMFQIFVWVSHVGVIGFPESNEPCALTSNLVASTLGCHNMFVVQLDVQSGHLRVLMGHP